MLVLAVLAAVAIPLYINTRRSSAARACKQNIATIATALSAFATRRGAYPAPADVMNLYTAANPGLIGAPEGLTQVPTCPYNGDDYTFDTTGTTGNIIISCPNGDDATDPHPTALGVTTTTDWVRDLPPPASESGIP